MLIMFNVHVIMLPAIYFYADNTNSISCFSFSYDRQLHQGACIDLFKSGVIYGNLKGTVDGPKGALEVK